MDNNGTLPDKFRWRIEKATPIQFQIWDLIWHGIKHPVLAVVQNKLQTYDFNDE